MTPQAFQEQSGVSRETQARLEAYVALLRKWNRRINLVSRASLEDVWRRHVLDSSQLMAFLPSAPSGRRRVLLDLGSGAGLPGLVLAILGAGEVHLVESDGRKAAFLREAVRVTAAEVRIHACRIEAVTPFPVDVVTARALAPLPRLLNLAGPFLGPDSQCLFLKGAGVAAELEAARAAWDFSMESHPSCTYCSGAVLVIGVNGRATTAS
ncbi:MAG: 16S rRNA (guanine(527)-N(7))-methyltransferase RsmG [Kiloniellales bacterium]|nr:16S rRNA (guanine(527)-N(7))-methyltransferase RsmG [Kiloniellales bacterium]